MTKRITGFYYENGICAGVTIEGIIDEKTKETEKVYFRRVIHAHWIPSPDDNDIYRCSACKCTSCIPKYITHDICPACGAVMDEEELTDEV